MKDKIKNICRNIYKFVTRSRLLNLIVTLFLATVFIAVLTYIVSPNIDNGETEEETVEVIPWDEESQEAESTEEELAETEPETEKELIFPALEYDFTEENVTIALEGLTREYTFAWVSDLHLISDHEAGDAPGDVHAEYLDAISRRYEELAITDDGVHAEELWPEIVKYLNYNDFDGVIFGGDIMDYCSNSNIALIKEGLDSLQIPYIYVRADHDYGTYYGGVFFTEDVARELHKAIDGDEISDKFWDKNEFMVLGIDNSTKDMPEYYLNMVKDVLSRERPVIMVTHVPYEPLADTSLAELSMQVRNTIYYWSEASDNYKPNLVTSEYLGLLYSPDTVVKQVLAGHLHASWDGMLSEQVPEHIFAPAFSGSIGIIHIIPKER